MNCEEASELIGAYIDGELPPSERRLLEQHIDDCAACQTLVNDAQNLNTLIRRERPFVTPVELQNTIVAKLNAIDQEPANNAWSLSTILATNTAALAVGILLTLLTTHYIDQQDEITEALVATHLRHTIQEAFGIVASNDRHTIRPWFTGKIDYAPPVVDLADDGFPLLAGRVEYIDRHAVAALTYGKRKHQISLFILPSKIATAGGLFNTTSRGFNINTWSNGEFTFSAVSDVNSDDLSHFVDLLRAALRRS